ncbi:MAG TPA: anthranilate synthase component I, partial [Candidatus Methanoperedenaceae archaeon]|nr:anthranilate synthase component I [Candidatus Methanoperedenaceae archaeon]
MEFDISESDFVELASAAPAIIVLLAKAGPVAISPLDAYASISGTFSYLLESVEKEKRHARFSFVGSDPDAVVTLKDRNVTIEYNERTELIGFIKESMKNVCDVREVPGKLTGEVKPGYDSLDAIRCAFPTSCGAAYLNRTGFDRQCFLGGGIGFTAYDVIYDAWLDVRTKVSDATDMQFTLVSKTVLFDHLTDSVFIALSPFVSGSSDPHIVYRNAKREAEKIERRLSANVAAPGKGCSGSALSCSMSQDEFQRAVSTAKKHIIDGDIFQAVLSRRYEITTDRTPFELYTALRSVNPSPYMYLFEFNGTSIIGASP